MIFKSGMQIYFQNIPSQSFEWLTLAPWKLSIMQHFYHIKCNPYIRYANILHYFMVDTKWDIFQISNLNKIVNLVTILMSVSVILHEMLACYENMDSFL